MILIAMVWPFRTLTTQALKGLFVMDVSVTHFPMYLASSTGTSFLKSSNLTSMMLFYTRVLPTYLIIKKIYPWSDDQQYFWIHDYRSLPLAYYIGNPQLNLGILDLLVAEFPRGMVPCFHNPSAPHTLSMHKILFLYLPLNPYNHPILFPYQIFFVL